MEQRPVGNVLTLRMADGNVIKFEQHETLPSTVALAREYVRAGYPDRYVIFAENRAFNVQTNPQKKEKIRTEHGIFMSVILRPRLFPSQAGFLGPLTAVSLATGLEAHTEKKIGIGWPSDVYCEGSMIGKTTLEARLDAAGAYEYLIVNFSVRLDPDDFPPLLGDIVKQVFTENAGSIPRIVGKDVLNRFFSLYSTLRTSQKFLDVYRQKFALRDVKVSFSDADGRKRHGRILGVDQVDCTLLVDSHGETVKIDKRACVSIPEKFRPRKN